MRDFGSCFSEYAVQIVSEKTSCFPSTNLIHSTQNRVICLYKIILSNSKHVLVTVTWSKTSVSQGLTIQFGDDPSNSFKLNANSRLFWKKKGSRVMEFDQNNSKVEIFWDLCEAKYNMLSCGGPEPISKYYVLVTIDSEICLILGDMVEDGLLKSFKNGNSMAKFRLISRQEYFSGNTLFSTKAKFSDNGLSHDILVHFIGENEGKNNQVLSISIDKKIVIREKKLQWNFRGNHTIFLDDLIVDLMWDIHDWLFNNSTSSSAAVFMFRTRSGLESRLWLEDKDKDKDRDKLKYKDSDKVEFSLMIYACKNI